MNFLKKIFKIIGGNRYPEEEVVAAISAVLAMNDDICVHDYESYVITIKRR